LADLSGVSMSGGRAVLVFGLRRFVFPLADAARAEGTLQTVSAARDRMKAPLDPEERRQRDPLEPPSVARPLALEVPLTRTAPRWEQRRWLFAAVVGAVLGGGLFLVRNAASDKKMYASVLARDDVASYKSYLVRGHRQRDAVAQLLLPRAELRLAI